MKKKNIKTGNIVKLASGRRGIVTAMEQDRKPVKANRYLVHFNDTGKDVWHAETELEKVRSYSREK